MPLFQRRNISKADMHPMLVTAAGVVCVCVLQRVSGVSVFVYRRRQLRFHSAADETHYLVQGKAARNRIFVAQLCTN